MKVTLDLDKLRREKGITQEEYTKLLGFAAAETGSLALNIVLGFGVIATAGGALALLQSAGASTTPILRTAGRFPWKHYRCRPCCDRHCDDTGSV